MLNQNITTNLTYGHSYKITCSSVYSRPVVGLNIYADNFNLKTFSNATTIKLLESTSTNCSDSFGNATLVFNFTINDPRLASMKTLSCEAIKDEPLLYPFILNSSTIINVTMDIPPGIYILFPQIQIAQLSGSNVTVICPTDDLSPFWFYSSPNNSYYIDNSDQNYVIDGKYSLTILNINQTKNGLFACGYIPANNSFKAYFAYSLTVEGKLFIMNSQNSFSSF